VPDWSSMAASFLPGAVGLLTGGPVAGLAGVGSGLGAIEAERLAVEKANREIGFKEREQVRLEAQQRVQAEHYATVDRQAEEAMKLQALEMRKLNMDIDRASQSKEGVDKVRAGLSEYDRILLDEDPKAWYAQREEKARLMGAGPVLESFVRGIPKGQGQKIADILGSKAIGDLVQSSIDAGAKPRKAFDFKPATEAGGGFLINEETGRVSFMRFENMTPSAKEDLKVAHEIQQEARQLTESQFKTGPMGAINMQGLAKTPQERDKIFNQMVNDRARTLAAERGVPRLFDKNPEESAVQAIRDGQLNSSSEVVAFLLSRGIPPDKVTQVAKDKRIGAAIREKLITRPSK